MRWIVAGVLSAAIPFLGATAQAQDYTVTTGTTGQYMEARPAGATLVNVTSALGGTATAAVTLPFEFPYYGRLMSNAVISAHGMLVLGATGAIQNTSNPQGIHGQVPLTAAFPYPPSGDVDGLVAPHWAVLFTVNEGPGGGRVYTWTTGTAPYRRYVISWDNIALQGSPLIQATIQCHLDETTGRIAFSYSTGWGLVGAWVGGIDSPVDSRFTVPPGIVNASNANNAYSGADIVFTPRTVSYTGSLLYDRVVSDATGIGNSTLPNQPLHGVRIELRRDGGIPAATSTSAADGTFSIAGVGIASASSGTLVAVARNSGCVYAFRGSSTARTAAAARGSGLRNPLSPPKYPWKFDPTLPEGVLGETDLATGVVRINPRQTAEQLRGTLWHEWGHWRPGGSSPSEVAGFVRALRASLYRTSAINRVVEEAVIEGWSTWNPAAALRLPFTRAGGGFVYAPFSIGVGDVAIGAAGYSLVGGSEEE